MAIVEMTVHIRHWISNLFSTSQKRARITFRFHIAMLVSLYESLIARNDESNRDDCINSRFGGDFRDRCVSISYRKKTFKRNSSSTDAFSATLALSNRSERHVRLDNGEIDTGFSMSL